MDGKFWVNNHAHVLVSKKGICQEFLFCQLEHKDITDVISGGTRAKLTRGQLDVLLMVLPPFPEQRRIAAALSDADELVASLDKLIEKKKRVKEGAMQRLLYGETRLPGFTGKWVEKKLGDCGSWLGGGTPSTSIPGYWNGSTPWISSSDIEEGNIWHITKNRFISKNAISNSATCICPKGTLHIVARVGIGKVAIASEPTCTSQDYANLVIAQDNVVFLAYLLSSVMRSKKDETQGTSIKGLSLDDLKSILLLLPPLSEQQAITGVLSDMDAEIAALSRERAEAERIKQGMMQELLTGKVRLT
jgi:type I restriction enzyme S subunit